MNVIHRGNTWAIRGALLKRNYQVSRTEKAPGHVPLRDPGLPIDRNLQCRPEGHYLSRTTGDILAVQAFQSQHQHIFGASGGFTPTDLPLAMLSYPQSSTVTSLVQVQN